MFLEFDADRHISIMFFKVYDSSNDIWGYKKRLKDKQKGGIFVASYPYATKILCEFHFPLIKSLNHFV